MLKEDYKIEIIRKFVGLMVVATVKVCCGAI